MAGFFVSRVLTSIVAFFALTLFVFIAFFAMPRNNNSRFARQTPPEYRLHGSMLGQYGHYVWRMLRHGDLGRSYGNREAVTTRLLRAAPVTLSLVAGGLVVWILIAVPLGLIAALRPRSLLDRGAMVLVALGLSVHPVWLGLMLSYLFGHELNVLPSQGYSSIANLSTGCDGLTEWTTHLILPWITYGILNAALFTMMLRALLIEEGEADYVRTATAKGVGKSRLVRKHLLRNVSVPLVTMLGIQAATSLAGVIFVEAAFDLPGLGGMLRGAAQRGDLPLTAGSILFLALAIMLINLVVDLAYVVIDPRLRLTDQPT